MNRLIRNRLGQGQWGVEPSGRVQTIYKRYKLVELAQNISRAWRRREMGNRPELGRILPQILPLH